MDEASIVNALQKDLQDYKIKPQIRRKESELHVLITRAEGDDLDYATLYDIVKNCINKLSIEKATTIIMYGRLAGAKQPEWQKSANIKPPLPLIELDLDELDDLVDIGAIGSLMKNSQDSAEEDDTAIQVGNLQPIIPENSVPDDFESFEKSLEEDLKLSPQKFHDSKIDDFDLQDLNLDDLDLDAFKADSLTMKDFELDSFELDSFESQESKNRMANSKTSTNSIPVNKDWGDEDLSLDQTTTVAAMPLPLPPPLPPTKRTPKNKAGAEIEKPFEAFPEVIDDNESETPPPSNKSLWLSVAFTAIAIAALGVCGWLLWERSAQQQYLANARNLQNQNLDPQKITKLDTLAETRNQLQTAVQGLEEIPDRPASLYGESQSVLQDLRPKLEEFDRKISIEQSANKNLESAKSETLEAAKLVQKPPHKSIIWQSAQEKRKQAVKRLESIPPESMLYADAQTRLKDYRAGLLQITKWAEIQQSAESTASTISPNIVSQLKQLKAKSPEKQKFLSQCKPIVQPQISEAEARKVGLPIPTLTEYLCAYYWD